MKKVLSLLISIIMVFGVFSIVPIDVSAVSIKCGISVEGGVTGNLDDAPLPKATSSFYSDESPCFSLVVDKDLYINYAELIIYKNGSEYTRATRTPNLTYFRFCNVQYDAFPAGSYTYEWNYHVAESASGPYNSYNSGKLSFKVSNQPTVTISKNKSFYANGETATFKVNASGGKNTLTYQWYKAVDIVGNKSTVISGAASSTLNITANSSSQGYYYYCIVSDGERKVISSLLYLDCDTSKPVVTLSSTNNVASTQTVTVKLSDNIGIKGYYWGTSSTYSNNSYTSTSNTSFSKSITSPGTYYVTAVDTYGNVSSTQSITFYKTTLNANGGSVSPTSILTMSGKSFVFPTPNRSGNYTYSGWSTSSSALNGVGSLTPSSNSTYYAVWKINYINVSNCTITLGISSYTYDGNAKQPSVTVKYGSTTLTKDTDYSVSYSNNTNAGTATVMVTGKGSYTGTATKTFTISAKAVSSTILTLSQTSYTYDGTAKKPTVTVKDGTKTLINGTDYTVSYSNNTNVGTATVTVTGKGNYTGTASKNFTVTEAPKINVSNCTITLGTSSYTYDGNAKQPSVTVKYGSTTLTKDTDYSVSYSNNTNAGTATVTVTGKGSYTGTATKTFTISAKAISSTILTLSQTSYTYDGTAKKPTVTVKDGTKTLINGTDYTVFYSNNTNAGTATVTVTGKGNYSGTATKSFTIKAKSISSSTVTLSQTSYTYDGTAKKPTVTVKDDTKTLTSGIDYTVSYSNNTNVGTATVTVTGKGNYSGTVTKNFTIQPNKTTFTWGRDNWRFNNSGPNFGNTYYINSKYYDKLMSGLNRLEKINVQSGLSQPWGGSCYGMAVTSILGYEGVLKPDNYTSGATCLNDISSPPSNEVKSLINYYFAVQYTDKMQQLTTSYIQKSDKTKINQLLSCLEDDSPTLFTYFWPPTYNPGNGMWYYSGHAVVAYDAIDTSGTINGFKYNKKILIYDNRLTGFADNRCVYINTDNYSWYLPYDGLSSNNDAVLGLITDSMNEINYHGYINGNNNLSIGEFVSVLKTSDVSSEISWSKFNHNDSIFTYNAVEDEEILYFSPFTDSSNGGYFNIGFTDSDSGYSMNIDNPQQQDISMRYENALIEIKTTNTDNVAFAPNGFSYVSGDDTDYRMTVTYNDGYYSWDWYSLSVAGLSVDTARLKPINEGYVLSATNLDNVTLEAINDNNTISLTFSTEYNSVFIYEIDENTIGLKVDTDNNGTYESDLFGSNSSFVLGDANGDGKVNVKDATEIQKAVAGLLSLDETEELAADADGSGKVNVKDATAIQKWVAGIETGFLIGEPVKKQ